MPPLSALINTRSIFPTSPLKPGNLGINSLLFSLVTILSGCSSYGAISNIQTNPSGLTSHHPLYSIQEVLHSKEQGSVALVLTLSGGGLRATAFAYGVLQALNTSSIGQGANRHSLLDDVDVISAVSGGSFIAAYYGLYGKHTFQNFKGAMLTQDIKSELISGVLNPFNWFLKTGRTEMAIGLYNETIFNHATFADLNKPDTPLILINATDLSNGVRFSFTQEYFDLICSDISDFSIARAVTASSAVPIAFNPVVIKNYQPCPSQSTIKPLISQNFDKNNYELKQVIKGLKEYGQGNYPYLHLVDGGLTDNLGLRAIHEAIELSGGATAFIKKTGKQKISHIAVISVDASTQTAKSIRLSNASPTLEQSMDAMTDIQIHRYNTSTLQLFTKSLDKWSRELSTLENKVEPHFIKLNFSQLGSTEQREAFNQIPTSLTLDEAQVNQLIAAGKQLLIQNPDFQNLLQSLNTPRPAHL